MSTNKNPLNIFSAAKHICFPRWDAGAIYINIIATMLYPYDDKKRRSYTVRASLEQVIISLRARGNECSSMQYASLIQNVAQYFDDASDLHAILFGAQINTPKNELEEKGYRGILVGCVLRTACMHDISIHKAFDIIADGRDYVSIPYKGAKKDITRNSFSNRIWKEFSPVAHYWASKEYFACAEGTWECQPPYRYPDQHFFSQERYNQGKPNGFRGFLLVADAYLRWATSFVPSTHTQRKPLQEMRESIYFPHPYYKL